MVRLAQVWARSTGLLCQGFPGSYQAEPGHDGAFLARPFPIDMARPDRPARGDYNVMSKLSTYRDFPSGRQRRIRARRPTVVRSPLKPLDRFENREPAAHYSTLPLPSGCPGPGAFVFPAQPSMLRNALCVAFHFDFQLRCQCAAPVPICGSCGAVFVVGPCWHWPCCEAAPAPAPAPAKVTQR